MSNTQFAEVASSDPFVQKLGRRAIRLLNDPTLERWQRERHIKKLQIILLAYQVKQAIKATQQEEKKSGGKGTQVGNQRMVADASQISARRREFSQAPLTQVDEVRGLAVATPLAAPVKTQGQGKRPVLRLAR